MSKFTITVLSLQCLLYSMIFANDSNGQSINDIYLPINFNESTLGEAFSWIETNTSFNFLYNSEVMEQELRITASAEKASLAEVLTLIAKNSNLKFRRINKTIVVDIAPDEALKKEEKPVIRAAQVTGTVTDAEDGSPLPGVNILVKGTTIGTTTDYAGNFSLDVGADAILRFSFIGFQSQEIKVGTQTIIDVALVPDLGQLAEIVVIGYGSVKKSDLTGSVSSVKEEELTAYPAIDAAQALQGRAAGVQVQSTNGEPGAEFRIRIRGGTSINADSDPLFVIDGFVGGILPPPEDIASIEVLKDASATAIYGSRGANGVVMVTTKSGKAGQMKINLNSSYSIQNTIGTLDLLNRDQYLDLQAEIFGPDNVDDGGASTDWQEEVLRQGAIQNHNLSIYGGSEKINYFISGTYYDQQGIIERSEFSRYSLTTNLNSQVTDWLNLGLNLITIRSNQEGVESQVANGGNQGAGVMTAAYVYNPSFPVFNPDGTFSVLDPIDNPVSIIQGRENSVVNDRTQTGINAEFKIIEGLTLNTSIGVVRENIRTGRFRADYLFSAGGVASASVFNRLRTDVLNENYLTYTREMGTGNLSIVLGNSYQSFRNESFSASSEEFLNNSFLFWDLDAGSSLVAPASSLTESDILSYYGRVNYNFDDRFLFTFTGRYDGASVFSEGNKWGFFPSGAVAWNVSNEQFMEALSNTASLKLRASYGLTGNQAIQPFQSFARFSTVVGTLNGTNLSNAIRPTNVANSNLTWETTAQLNIGADIGLFEGRVNVTVDYYNMQTEDLLFRTPLPSYSGFRNRLENIGEVSNRGVELTLNTINIDREFSWNTTLNFSLNRNRVESLPGGNDIFYSSRPSTLTQIENNNVLREGEPVGVFYGFIFDGLYQEGDEFLEGGGFDNEAFPGGQRIRDINDDGELDVINDRTIIGDPNPDFTWGLNNNFSYKGFDLNIFFQSVIGGDILNLTRTQLDNSSADALDRWTPTNTDTNIPASLLGRNNRVTTRFIEDGTYIRLKNIALGYNLPMSMIETIRLSSVRIFISAQNILTFTDYSGIDPEVSYDAPGQNSNLSQGIDYDSYPNAKSVTFGVNIGL